MVNPSDLCAVEEAVRPKKLFTPDSKLPAFQRIGLILSGGAAWYEIKALNSIA